LDRWLATFIELEQNYISSFIILTFCSSEFVEFLIGYSSPSSHIRTFHLLRMPGPNGVLSLRGDLKRAFDYDIQAVQIVAKAQAASGREEIATVAAEINSEELEIIAKKPSILAPPKEANVKQIDMGTGDPSKTATISAHLGDVLETPLMTSCF
jgi:hypothetical protein